MGESSGGPMFVCSIIDQRHSLAQGLDLRNVERVVLWKAPKTFCSLIQKFGRCARDFALLGECILYVSEAYYSKYESLLKEEDMIETENTVNLQDPEDEEGNEATQAVDATQSIRVETMAEDTVVAPKRKGKQTKFQGLLAARDFRFLIWYIVTKKCQHIPWNIFFENAKKGLILQQKSYFATDVFCL